jgi:hypothetical protein
MQSEIIITVGDVSDVEAHVFARYSPASTQASGAPSSEPVLVRGTLRGPFCETARTLPAEIPFRDLGPAQISVAKAIVPDPCVWSPELPHLYQVDVEARQGERVLGEYHGKIGLRPK